MMRISAGDIAKFKAALKNYRHAQEEERIRIERVKREEQARIERERQEKQRQDEERAREMKESLSSVGALVLIAGIIALIYFYWESILGMIGYYIAIVIVVQIVIALWPILAPILVIVALGVAFIILKEGCGG